MEGSGGGSLPRTGTELGEAGTELGDDGTALNEIALAHSAEGRWANSS
jgi:hypothetical protein